MHGVIQEFTEDGLEDPTFDAFVTKLVAEEIIDDENRTGALVKAVEDGDITYKPKGFFKKIMFWFKNLFR